MFMGGTSVLLGIALSFLPEIVLFTATDIVLALQYFPAAFASIMEQLPENYRFGLDWAKSASFWFSIFRPGCTNPRMPIMTIFLYSTCYAFAVAVYFMLCAILYQFIKRESNERWFWASRHKRVQRALIMAGQITFLELFSRSLLVLQYREIDGSYYLAHNLQVKYFGHDHIPVAFMAIAVLIICVALPAIMTYKLYTEGVKKKLLQKENEHFMQVWGFIARDLRDPQKFWWVNLVSFLTTICNAMAISLFLRSSVTSMCIVSGALLAQTALWIILWPNSSFGRNIRNVFLKFLSLAFIGVSTYIVGYRGVAIGIGSAMLVELLLGVALGTWRRDKGPLTDKSIHYDTRTILDVDEDKGLAKKFDDIVVKLSRVEGFGVTYEDNSEDEAIVRRSQDMSFTTSLPL